MNFSDLCTHHVMAGRKKQTAALTVINFFHDPSFIQEDFFLPRDTQEQQTVPYQFTLLQHLCT